MIPILPLTFNPSLSPLKKELVWENLDFSPEGQQWRRLLTFVATVGLLFVCAVVLVLARALQTPTQTKLGSKEVLRGETKGSKLRAKWGSNGIAVTG